MNNKPIHFIQCIAIWVIAWMLISPVPSWAQVVEWYLIENNGGNYPHGTWSQSWDLVNPLRVKVILTGFDIGDEIPYTWHREITNDLTIDDRIRSGVDSYTVQGVEETEIFYIEIPLPDATPLGWGEPNSSNKYTATFKAGIPGYFDETTWYQWWDYNSSEETGTCVSLYKNGVSEPVPLGEDAWSMEWGDVLGDQINPKYSDAIGWYDEIVVTVQDLSTPLKWHWIVTAENDSAVVPIQESGSIDAYGGMQQFTITIPYPAPGCAWGAPNSAGFYQAHTALWISTCGTKEWDYIWTPECPPCPGDLNVPFESISYSSTSDMPPLDFPGYEWPEEGFDFMPEYMYAMTSYFKSVLITSGVERAFPGWCVDLFTLLGYGEVYTGGDVRLHRTLNLDENYDGYADYNPDTGTTSNVAININGDIIGAPENLARVNYLMNQYYRGAYEPYGVTYAEIQAAIWTLLSIGQGEDNGFSNIEIDPDTGYGSAGLITWDDELKQMVIQDALQEGVERYSPTHCELMGVVVQTGEDRQTVLMMVPYCFYKCMEAMTLLVGSRGPFPDELNESDGFHISGGSDIVSSGTGLETLPDGVSGEIHIDVPGEVVRAFLYWEGETSHGVPQGVIDTITVNGEEKYGILIGGPEVFYSDEGYGDIVYQSYRADITDIITTGSNTITIDGANFDYPVDQTADGAGVLVVYEDGSGDSEIFIRDGQDLTYHGYEGNLQTTVPQTFTFTPTEEDRTATLIIINSDIRNDEYRPNQVIVDVGENHIVYEDLLGGEDGNKWDTETIDVTIPGGETSLTVEVVSPEGTVDDGASISWIVTALSVPDQGEGELVPKETPNSDDISVSVDGNIDDWILTDDFFDYMYRAGEDDKTVESKLYLQYDDVNEVLYTLVLAEEGVTVLEQDDDAYVKIDGIKLVDGSFGDDDVTPDFEWVYDTEGNLIGWESSTPLGDGEYNLNVHTQVYDDGSDQTSAVAGRGISLLIEKSKDKPIILAIDEDSIDNGIEPNSFSAMDVNDDIANIGVRDILQYFNNHVGERITLFTGQVGDEGWFALKTIPDSWMKAGPTNDGVVNYLKAGPGLGTAGEGVDEEDLLDAIADVTPLRASGLKMLEGYMVCAVVYDSDVSINYSPLTGNLKGATLGIVAFKVISVQSNYGYSDSTLPKVVVEILDLTATKQLPMQLLSDAPEPISSSEPMDVNPIEPFTEDLVAYWDFNDAEGIVAQDRSPNAYNGVLINDPTWYAGYDLGGISLNGAGNYVDGGFFDVGGSEFSVMAWIKANQFNHLAESDARIVSKALGVNEDAHYWMLSTVDSGGPKLCFRLKTNGGTSTLTASSGDLEPGVWTHVAAVYNGSRMLLYKDGEEVGRLKKSGSLNLNYLIPVWIGANPPDAYSKPFDGIIDEVRIYERAVSVGEILEIMDYQSSIPPTPTPTPTLTPTPTSTPTPSPTFTPTPVASGDVAAYWSFNENGGLVANDWSGNNHDGVLINAPVWAMGYENSGLLFDGYNDYVDAGYFNVSGSAMTISAWFKADRFDNLYGHDARIISKAWGTSDSDHYWMLSTRLEGVDTRLRFRLKTGGTTSVLIADSGNLQPDVWIHAAAVYDGSYMILYKDGVEVGRMEKTGAIDVNSLYPVWIGGNPPVSSSRPFDGVIDEVKIFNRALSPAEVLDIATDSITSTKIYDSQILLQTPTPTATPTPTMTPTPELSAEEMRIESDLQSESLQRDSSQARNE